MESITHTTYDHPRAGLLTAVPAGDYRLAHPGVTVPVQADWIAAAQCPGPPLGFISDNRADAGGEPSAVAPDDDFAQPFEAYDAKGRFITTTHSLRGALLSAGNRT